MLLWLYSYIIPLTGCLCVLEVIIKSSIAGNF